MYFRLYSSPGIFVSGLARRVPRALGRVWPSPWTPTVAGATTVAPRWTGWRSTLLLPWSPAARPRTVIPRPRPPPFIFYNIFFGFYQINILCFWSLLTDSGFWNVWNLFNIFFSFSTPGHWYTANKFIWWSFSFRLVWFFFFVIFVWFFIKFIQKKEKNKKKRKTR